MKKEPPDVIVINTKSNEREVRLNNMLALIDYAFNKGDKYLHTKAILGYLNIVKQQINDLP